MAKRNKTSLLNTLTSEGTTDANQLKLFRSLLAQQSMPTISISPVQDIGGGISQAANNILQATLYNRAQKNQQALLDRMFAAQQAQAEQEAKSQQAYANDLRLPISVVQNADASTINQMMKQKQDDDALVGMADALRFNNPGMSYSEAWIAAKNQQAQNKLAESMISDNVARNISPVLSSVNPNTPGGSNLIQGTLGFQPQTSFDFANKFNTAKTGAINAELAQRFGGAKAYNDVVAGSLGNQGAALNNQQQGITNQALPQLLQNRINSTGLANDQASFNLDRDIRGLNFLTNTIEDGSYSDPASYAKNAAMAQGLKLGNPYAPGMQLQQAAAGFKPGMADKNIKNLTKVNQQFGLPAAPQGTAATGLAGKPSMSAAPIGPSMSAAPGREGAPGQGLAGFLYSEDPGGLKQFFGQLGDNIWNAPGLRFYRGE